MSATENARSAIWICRPPTPADDEFLYKLYCSTRDDEMALWGAPADQQAAFLRMQFDAQRAHYGQAFARADHAIITIDGRPVDGYLVTGVNTGGEGPAGNATAGPRIVNSSGSCP